MSTSQSGTQGGGGGGVGGGASQSQEGQDVGGSSNGIGGMESQIQKLYCFSRIPGEDFVHIMAPDAFNALEDFCSLQNMDSSTRNPPLLVVGDRGVGKSALLANWMMKRHRSNQRSRVSATAEEYVFYHAVGCTRQSLKVSTFLRRLITDIKQKCELSREVPVSHEKLRWELPRFLDLAAKKCRAVIIVIDGLHRLLKREEDDDEDEEHGDLNNSSNNNNNNNTGDLSDNMASGDGDDSVSPDGGANYTGENNNSKRHAHTSNRADINEGSLSWLPLDFAPNVRVILSATLPLSQLQHVVSKYGGKDKEEDILHSSTNPGSNLGGTAATADLSNASKDSASKKHRILQEMERRQWAVMKLRILEKNQAKSVIEAFLHKSVHGDATAQTMGPFMATILTGDRNDNLFQLTSSNSSNNAGDQPDIDEIPGFLLFESQINTILGHSQGTNPLFLRLFLRCAHYAARRGFSLWRIYDEWITADSVQSLLMRILRTFEVGFDRTREGCQADCDRTMSAGGLPALRHQYPWHPSFPDKPRSTNEDALISAEFRNALDFNKDSKDVDTEGNSGSKDASKGQLSHSVLQNLGDQKWQAVSEQATITLDEARRNTERSLNIAVETIALKSKEENTSFVELLIKQVRELHSESKSNPNAGANVGFNVSTVSTSTPTNVKTNYASYNNSIDDNSEYQSDLSLISAEDEEDEDDEDNPDGDQFDVVNDLPQQKVEPGKYSRASIISMMNKQQQGKDPNRRTSKTYRTKNDDSDEDSSASNKKAPQEDPSEDFAKLPLYIRGGSSVKGFGDMIGDALSLLYVARHGLKESELWSILATLHKKRNSGPGLNKDKESEKKALVAIFMIARSAIEDLCRNHDSHKSGCISRLQLLKVLVKVHPSLQKVDIANLLVDLGLLRGINDNANYDEMEAWLAEDSKPTFNYMGFLEQLSKVDRQMKLKGSKSKLATNKDTSDDFDHLSTSHLVDDDNRDGDTLDFMTFNRENASTSTAATSALGPIMEEALLSVLCALGVIHSPDNQILVLPCDGSAIRNVIKSKYVTGRLIASDVMTRESWHGFFIRYFQKERNTMRRCEELPYHLQLCRNWVPLRDAVSDLDTFSMMFNSDLREELLGYWLLLTEGPLFTSAETEREYAVNPSLLENEHARILVEVDTAAARGLSEKEARLQLLKGKVAPFDIIEELNASLEVWMATMKPGTAAINYKITLIAQFMLCYCKHVSKSPIFARIGVDARGLRMFNIIIDNLEIKETEMKSSDEFGAADGDRSVATNTSVTTGNGSVPVNTKFNVAAVIYGNPNLVIPTPAMRESHLYFYLRWVWLQFPWLALHHAPVVGRRDRNEAAMNHLKYTGMSMADKKGGGMDPLAPTKVGKMDNHNNLNDLIQDDVEEFEKMRFWNVKKLDPSVPIVEKSDSRKKSEIDSYLNDNKTSLDALDMSFKRIYKELLESKSKGHSNSRYRRSFQEELEMTASIPHSEHCKKTLRAGTLFPALAASLKEQNEQLEKNSGGSMYADAAQTLKRGGSGLHFQPTIEELINTYNHEETIDGYNTTHSSAVPISSEEQVAYSKEFSRLNKLHAVYDRLVALKNTRKTELDKARNQFDQRDMLDQEAAASLIAGETVVTELQEKQMKLGRSLITGEEINIGYKQIIGMCDSCPPFTDYHVRRLESEVFLARQQLKDLKAHRTNMYIEAQRIESIKKREIYDKYRYYRTARQDIAIKKKVFIRNSTARGYPIPVIEKRASASSYRLKSPISPGMKGPSVSEDSMVSSEEAAQKEMETKAISRLMAMPDMKGYAEKMNKKRDMTRQMKDDAGDVDDFEMLPYSKENDAVFLSDSAAANVPLVGEAKGKKKKIEVPQEPQVIEIVDKTELAKSAISAFTNLSKTPLQKALDNAKKVQSKMTVDYIAEKTGFHTADELIERYNAANKMAENLKSHQILADSRLAQLRAEYTELYSSLGDSYYLSVEEAGSGSEKDSSGAVVEHDSRYLDNKLFASEMRLNALRKQQEKSVYILNEVKMGVVHIISLLQANNRLLSALPRSSAPRVLTDADLATAISWVEERVLAINEAMMLESAKPTASAQTNAPIDAGGDTGISNRQNELATVVMNSIIRRRGGLAPVNAPNKKEKKKQKIAGGMSSNIIGVNETNATFISSPRNVMITSTNEIDKNFDDKIKRLEEKRDKRAILLEQLEGIDNNINAVKGVSNFVSESLQSSDSQGLLRKVNIFAAKKQGRFAGLGGVLEDVLRTKGPAYLAAATETGPKPSVHASSSLLLGKKGEKKSNRGGGGGGNGEAKGSDKNGGSINGGSIDDDGTFGGSFTEAGSDSVGADN